MFNINRPAHIGFVFFLIFFSWALWSYSMDSALAQPIQIQMVEISSSPNPVGSGARALGIGGAFIGVADDATAASWNPAGLIQLERPEISTVGAYNHRNEDTTYTAYPDASGPQRIATYELNYFSASYPFVLFNRNMIVSLNYQHLYDFNKKVNYSYTINSTTGPPLSLKNDLDYKQEGDLRTISPAFSIQITPHFSLGMTLNIWMNGWETKHHFTGSGTYIGYDLKTMIDIDEEYSIDGFNFNFNTGILWNITNTFTLGAVFKSPLEAKLKHHYRRVSSMTFPSKPDSNTHSEVNYTEKETLNMPMSYGLGLAIRFSDALTFDLDSYWTEWGDYIIHKVNGEDISPITGKPESESAIDPTTQIRIGGEYLIIGMKTVIPIRTGIFYDPEPSKGNPGDFFGFSLGTGIAYKRIIFDSAYQYRFGRKVRTIMVGNEDSSQDVDQHTIYMSLIYHF